MITTKQLEGYKKQKHKEFKKLNKENGIIRFQIIDLLLPLKQKDEKKVLKLMEELIHNEIEIEGTCNQ